MNDLLALLKRESGNYLPRNGYRPLIEVIADFERMRKQMNDTKHTPTYSLKFYLNGNDQMHGQRWIADAKTGAVVPKEDVLAMCNAHDELVAALFAVTNELACREAGSATQRPTSSAAMLIARAVLAKLNDKVPA